MAGRSLFSLLEERLSLRPDWMQRWQMDGGETERVNEEARALPGSSRGELVGEGFGRGVELRDSCALRSGPRC